MKLSIITINYNNAEGLRKTLASVAAQTYADIEHIIVDGGSTDNSVEVIREYEQSLTSSLSPLASRLKWISEPDKGIYNAMNKGLEIALGKRIVNGNHTSCLITSLPKSLITSSLCDYIQILNSGDILAADDVTERMFEAMDNSLEKNPPILYGNMIKEWPNGKRHVDTCMGKKNAKESTLTISETQWTMYDFTKGTINHDPTYIRRDIYEKYGLYDESLKICSDWKWFVKTVVFGDESVYYIPMNVTVFDMTGISETNLIARENERHNELEKILPKAILNDYDTLHFPISQYKRLKRYKLWSLVYFMERVLFKLEKWGILSK